MDPAIQMETIFGDGSQQSESGDFFGKLLSAGKRVLTGESLFTTVFSNQGSVRQKVAFAAPYPGKIIALDLEQHGGQMLCQKDAFLCAAKGVSLGIAFQKKLGAGLFGGEGFILQKLDGDGLAFVHAGGTIHERTLAAGETLRVDTGCLVAFEPRVQYDIQMVNGREDRRCSAARGSSSPRSPGRARSGCSRCRSPASRRASSPRPESPADGARRVPSSARWGICSTATASQQG